MIRHTAGAIGAVVAVVMVVVTDLAELPAPGRLGHAAERAALDRHGHDDHTK